jgi:hypothetical protein
MSYSRREPNSCPREIRLNKFRAGVDVYLTKRRIAGVNKAVWSIRGNNYNPAGFYLSAFISDGDRRAPFDGERNFDVRMSMQRRPLSRLGSDDISGKGRALRFAYEIVGHPNKG